MKPFTNKLLLGLGACLVFAACSSKEQDVPATPTEEVTVAVAPTEAPAPVVQEPAAVPKPAPVKTTVKKAPSNEAVLNIKAWDKKLKFLQTHFAQTSEYDGVPISSSQGTLSYDKDKNLLRLDTTDTAGHVEQTAITDKQQILILDGQGREITTLSWQEWQQGQPNQALFDFGNYTALLARHNVTLKEPHVLALTPKEGEQYTLYLTLAEDDYFPTSIKIVADLMTTEAILTDTVKNQALPFNTFRAGGLFK